MLTKIQIKDGKEIDLLKLRSNILKIMYCLDNLNLKSEDLDNCVSLISWLLQKPDCKCESKQDIKSTESDFNEKCYNANFAYCNAAVNKSCKMFEQCKFYHDAQEKAKEMDGIVFSSNTEKKINDVNGEKLLESIDYIKKVLEYYGRNLKSEMKLAYYARIDKGLNWLVSAVRMVDGKEEFDVKFNSDVENKMNEAKETKEMVEGEKNSECNYISDYIERFYDALEKAILSIFNA